MDRNESSRGQQEFETVWRVSTRRRFVSKLSKVVDSVVEEREKFSIV